MEGCRNGTGYVLGPMMGEGLLARLRPMDLLISPLNLRI